MIMISVAHQKERERERDKHKTGCASFFEFHFIKEIDVTNKQKKLLLEEERGMKFKEDKEEKLSWWLIMKHQAIVWLVFFFGTIIETHHELKSNKMFERFNN